MSKVFFISYISTLQLLRANRALSPRNLEARCPLYGPRARGYFHPCTIPSVLRYPQAYAPPPDGTLRPTVPSDLWCPQAYGTLRPTVPSGLRYPQAYGTLRPTVPSGLRYPHAYGTTLRSIVLCHAYDNLAYPHSGTTLSNQKQQSHNLLPYQRSGELIDQIDPVSLTSRWPWPS